MWEGNERRAYNLEAISVKLENIHSDIQELKEEKRIQNGRIGKLETRQSWMMGGIAVIGALFGIKH